MAFFPTKGESAALSDRFNREMGDLFVGVRDFLVAHYVLTERDDSAFWRHCRNIDIPASLAEKLEMFAARGEIIPAHQDLFRDSSWYAVLQGQGIVPASYHPIADRIGVEELKIRISAARKSVVERLASMTSPDPIAQF